MTIHQFEICLEGFPFYDDFIGQIQAQFMEAKMQCVPDFPPLPSCPKKPFGENVNRFNATLDKWINTVPREYMWLLIGELIDLIKDIVSFPEIFMPDFDVSLEDLIEQNVEKIKQAVLAKYEELQGKWDAIGLPDPLYGGLSSAVTEMWEAFQIACAEFMQIVVEKFFDLIQPILDFIDALMLPAPDPIPQLPDLSEFKKDKIVQKLKEQYGGLNKEGLKNWWDVEVKDMLGGIEFPELPDPLFPDVSSKAEEFWSNFKNAIWQIPMKFFKDFMDFIDEILALLNMEFTKPHICFPMIIICPELPEPEPTPIIPAPKTPKVPEIPKPEA